MNRTKDKFKLVLESKVGPVVDKQDIPNVLMTPDGLISSMNTKVNDDYWLLRVKVSETQAIVGFPKFGLLGIGFAVENSDWNTNLPSNAPANEILTHILTNKGDNGIPDERCLKAIQMIQDEWKRLDR